MKSFYILLVEDTEAKRSRILKLLPEKMFPYEVRIEWVSSYVEAVDKLKSTFYDVVILDIKIPFNREPPTEIASQQLISDILDGHVVKPTHIIGLTEHAELFSQECKNFEENMFAIFLYNSKDDSWANQIAMKLRYLAQSREASLLAHYHNYDLDVLIMVARYENEFLPIRKQLFGNKKSVGHPLWGQEGHFGRIRLGHDKYVKGALLSVNETGLAKSAAVTAQAISVLRPRLVAMLGMCCGFNHDAVNSPRKILDVIIALESSCWEQGRYTEPGVTEKDAKSGFQTRATVRVPNDTTRHEIMGMLEQNSKYFQPKIKKLCDQDSFKKIKTAYKNDVRNLPEVVGGKIVSGSSVVADEDQIGRILKLQPTAIGLEMEIYSVYTAAETTVGSLPAWIAIKGVADFGDGTKKKDAQNFASRASAEIFREVIANLSIFSDI